jgi:putative tricarboxylic transport membrane protein
MLIMLFARYADAILGALLIFISGLLLAVLIPLGVQVPKSNKVLALAPDFWINIIVWTTLALGVYILMKGIVRLRSDLDPDEVSAIEEETAHRYPFSRAVLGVLAAIAGLFVYLILIHWIGMVAASTIAFIGFVLLGGERRLRIALPLATLLPVGLYYFFLKVAGIPMPLGIFG